MRLLCDHQIFSSFRYSGISRYFCELFEEFNSMAIEWRVSCYFGNNAFLEELTPVRRFLDIFHSTYSKPYLPKYTRGKPYVITVQDTPTKSSPNSRPPNVRRLKRSSR